VNNILHLLEHRSSLTQKEEEKLAEDVAQQIKQIHAVVYQQKACRTHIVQLAILPMAWNVHNEWPNKYTTVIHKINRILEQDSESESQTHFLDCGNLFLKGTSDRGIRIDENLLGDLLHPSSAGHDALAECVLSRLDEIVRESFLQNISLRYSGWNECSQACGVGWQSRKTECVATADIASLLKWEHSQQLATEACKHLPVDNRQLVQLCNLKPCGHGRQSVEHTYEDSQERGEESAHNMREQNPNTASHTGFRGDTELLENAASTSSADSGANQTATPRPAQQTPAPLLATNFANSNEKDSEPVPAGPSPAPNPPTSPSAAEALQSLTLADWLAHLGNGGQGSQGSGAAAARRPGPADSTRPPEAPPRPQPDTASKHGAPAVPLAAAFGFATAVFAAVAAAAFFVRRARRSAGGLRPRPRWRPGPPRPPSSSV